MTSVVVRTFGWMVILGRGGLVPDLLNLLGLVNRRFTLMHTETAIVIGMVQVLFPFMVPSILGVVMRIDPRLPVLASSIYEAATKTLEWHFAAAQSIILPVVVAGVSFTAGDYVTFPPQGLSPRWYEAIMSSSVCTGAALTSLQLAVAVTLSATAIGASAAIVLHRGRLPGTGALSALFLAPLILPAIIFALGLLTFWSATIGRTSFYAMWLGHTIISIPYVIRTTLAVLSTSDKFLEEAGRTMGAGPWKVIFHVVVPQALPGIAAGAFFAVNISFDEAILSLFLRSPEITTLPIQIHTQLEFSSDPSIAAASTLMIALAIDKGEFISLLGPSGCGKTTLLRMIAGLEEASGGSIHIGGKDSTRLPPEQRDIAMVFQSYALLPHLTVLENVMFPLRMRKLGNRAEQREQADAALKLVQLAHLAQRRPRELSGGQQQRVAVARAVVSSPQVLLLDEPLSNLDARLREDMQEELIQLHRQTGLTTVFVTHDQEEALSLSDRIVLLNAGRIEQEGAPADQFFDVGEQVAVLIQPDRIHILSN